VFLAVSVFMFFAVSVVMTFAVRFGQGEGDILQRLPLAVGIDEKDLRVRRVTVAAVLDSELHLGRLAVHHQSQRQTDGPAQRPPPNHHRVFLREPVAGSSHDRVQGHNVHHAHQVDRQVNQRQNKIIDRLRVNF